MMSPLLIGTLAALAALFAAAAIFSLGFACGAGRRACCQQIGDMDL